MQNSWTKVTKDLGQYITLTNQVCFRVKACDFGHTTTVVAGLDDQGRAVSAGVYFYRLKAGAFEQSRRMTILR